MATADECNRALTSRLALDKLVPRLRSRCGGEVTLRIAGSSPSAEVAALAGLPGVELVADPPALASSYAWADLAVISLAADGAQAFTDACLELLHEPLRAQRLAMAARALVDARYSREHGLRAVREALAPARAP